VPEREVMALQLGQTVNLIIEGEKAQLPAKLTRISPSLDMTSRSLTVEADLPNPGLRLRAGLFAEADILVDPTAKAMVVPAREVGKLAGTVRRLEEAVREFAGVEKVRVIVGGEVVENNVLEGGRNAWRVMTIRGGEMVEKKVETGRRDEQWVELKKGLTDAVKVGDRVTVQVKTEAEEPQGAGKS
jgi:multidrug efflux pump subunit AcrA (membrane-fusion protein)